MQSFKRTAFYFISHADDWQLFMAPEISQDIADNDCKVVIIHTTTGDAGKNKAYWRAREIASFESLLFRVSAIDEHISPLEQTRSTGDHTSAYIYSIKNCVMYFLRLPDGNHNGAGFPAYHDQSLHKFRLHLIPTLTSADDQSVYTGWEHLSSTLDTIIFSEQSGAAENTCLNLPDPDTTLNAESHNDHFNTALLVQSTKAYLQYDKRLFLDYVLIRSNDFLSGEELFWKIGMFSIYHQAMFRETGHSTIAEDAYFIPWCFRNSSFRSIQG